MKGDRIVVLVHDVICVKKNLKNDFILVNLLCCLESDVKTNFTKTTET